MNMFINKIKGEEELQMLKNYIFITYKYMEFPLVIIFQK